jgi:hypothetical protein
MDSKEEHKNRKFQAALLIAMLLLFGITFCRRCIWATLSPDAITAGHTIDSKRASNPWNRLYADSSLRFAMDGDLIVRSGADAVSALFKKANRSDKSYSHAGIVFIENGGPMVYNCMGDAEDPYRPIRRDSLSAYISPNENTGFAIYRFHLTRKQVEQLHGVCIQYFKEARAFDPHFDLKTDSLLYCTEFVYKAVIQVTGKNDYFPLTQMNAFSYVAVDNLYSRKDMKLICKIGYKQ